MNDKNRKIIVPPRHSGVTAGLVKDRDCIHCKKMFDCKGKPRGTLCVNKEEEGTGNPARKAAMWDHEPDTED